MRRAATIAIALAAAVTPVHADDPVVPGEVIVVVGARAPRPQRDVPASVTVIDRDDMARSPMVLVDEILRTLPSVGTFRRSSSLVADPTSQGLDLRGVGPSASSRALILRDGVPVNDPFGGWMSWRALPVLGIDRIEVAPGGASALFGNLALGGVVDVVSRPIEPRRLEAVVAGGALGTGRAAAAVTDVVREIGVAADAEVLRSRGYTPIAAAQRGPVDHPAASDHVAAGVRVERGGWHATARWFDETLDAGTDHTTADLRAFVGGAGWRGRGLDVDVFGGLQRFDQARARVDPARTTATPSSAQRTPSNHQGAAVTWRHDAIVIGGDARRVAGTATDTLSPPMVSDDTVIARAGGGEQRFAGAFVEDTARLGAVELTAALRLDAWQDVDGARARTTGDGAAMTTALSDRRELQLDPRLGALVHVSDELAVRASAYRAFRAPTLNELYRPFQVGTILTDANAELAPETLWGAELGAQLAVGELSARATGFANRLDDPIANVTLDAPLPSGATRQRQNLGRARIAGLELELGWRPSPRWQLAVAQSFTDAVVTAAPGHDDLVGKRLPQVPRRRATASIAFDDPRWLTATLQVRYLGQQFEDDREALSIGAVALVDLRASRALGRGVRAFVAGQNLFDRRYLVGRAGVDTEGAPRTFELGLAYDGGW